MILTFPSKFTSPYTVGLTIDFVVVVVVTAVVEVIDVVSGFVTCFVVETGTVVVFLAVVDDVADVVFRVVEVAVGSY